MNKDQFGFHNRIGNQPSLCGLCVSKRRYVEIGIVHVFAGERVCSCYSLAEGPRHKGFSSGNRPCLQLLR